VNTLKDLNSLPASFRQSDCAPILRIRFCHVGETRAKALLIRTDESISALQIDVIAQNDQASWRELRSDSPRRIGEQHALDSYATKDAHWERHAQHAMSFVVVNASLHHGHRNFADAADHQIAGMPFGSRNG